MLDNKPSHIRPFPVPANYKYISSINWPEAPSFNGKAGNIYRLTVQLHKDYSTSGLKIYIQQIIHNYKPCIIQPKIYKNDDRNYWYLADNDWVPTLKDCLIYEWLITLPKGESYKQFFRALTTTSGSDNQHRIEYEFGIIVSA